MVNTTNIVKYLPRPAIFSPVSPGDRALLVQMFPGDRAGPFLACLEGVLYRSSQSIMDHAHHSWFDEYQEGTDPGVH
jgi:hypothetical protein